MTTPVNCSDQPVDPLHITPESDISGLGVFIGFVSASYILLFIVVIYYIFGYDPTSNPFGTEEHSTLTRARPNPFDQLVLKVARRILCIDAWQWQALYKNGRLAAAFDKGVINMADIQIVNGLAILIAGLLLLHQNLSALHWKMVVYLAWFACTTNLSAIIFLRPYLIRNPFERTWRLGSTFILLVMLVVSLVPTGHFFWRADCQKKWEHIEDAAPSAYAICYFNADFKGHSFVGKNSMLLSIFLLVFSYTVRVFKLFRGFGNCGLKARSLSACLVETCLKSAAFLQRKIGSSSFAERLASNMLVSAHFVVCLWIDIATSMASDIFWLIITITWGSVRMVELKRILYVSPALPTDPTWSFGQILAVLLVAGPLLVLIRSGREAFTPDSHESPRPSIVEPDHYGLSLQEGVVHNGNQEPRTGISRAAEEESSSCFDEPLDSEILDPSSFTEYYEKSPWMCWAPAICLTYEISAVVTLLSTESDPISQMRSFSFWFVLEQGALLQYLFIICFYLCKKWKHPTVHVPILCYVAFVIIFAILSRERFILAPMEDPTFGGEFHVVPLVFLCGTVGVFIITMIAARLPRIVRILRTAVRSRFPATSTESDPGTPPPSQGEA
ncbi:hypothetical protein F4821DRAFT_264985 [Hypoxylon rubiginosum]|uniref:Uncharacterized protein n=1 Tax=Hypoxylon rubiginosum TaxID=110542 RepID=A0ACC0CLU4_9PEZI|nr:hypothetical protein F4821DRAFT_264985 [Hypoxylon rubiginosum]